MKKTMIALMLLTILIQTYGHSQNISPREGMASQISVTPTVNNAISMQMRSAFSKLYVNMNAIRKASGIPSFTIDDFDFINLYRTEKQGQSELAYCAAYRAATTKEKYAFVLFQKNGVFLRSMLVKANPDRSSITYYDLNTGRSAEIAKSGPSFTYQSRGFDTGVTTTAPGCGQAVMDCITDAYSNHGWLSVWVSIQSIFVPATGVGITLGCIAANCKN